MLVAGAVQAAPAAASSSNEACRLLTFTEVREVQKVALKDTRASERSAREQRHSTCIFTTEDFVHSVSVTLTTSTGRPDTLNEYWARTFSRDRHDEEREKSSSKPKRADPPLQRIGGLGNDAVWTGDAKAGSLYVLVPGALLRVSVGGVAEVAERLRRSRALAAVALARLERDSSRTARKPIPDD